jgi:hypothetical protein
MMFHSRTRRADIDKSHALLERFLPLLSRVYRGCLVGMPATVETVESAISAVVPVPRGSCPRLSVLQRTDRVRRFGSASGSALGVARISLRAGGAGDEDASGW